MNRAIAIAVAALAVVGTLVWYFGFRGEEPETYRVQRGSIDVTIQTIGRVQSTGATTVRTRIAGEVQVVAARAGDTVAAGDIIVQLNTDPLERAVEAAERQLEEAEFTLQVAQQEAEANPDDQNRAFAVIRAGQGVEAAERALSDAQEAIRQASIQAPRAGILQDVTVSQGDLLNRSQPVAVLFAREDLQIIANVDELDLVNVRQGAEATIRLDAFPAEEVMGRVESTAPAAREQGGATVFATTIALDIPEGLDIRPGMNADVTIVTEARDDVLLIPQTAVTTVGERAFVDVRVDGEWQEREVVLGYRSGGQVEVITGLEEGDEIRLS